MTSPSIKKNGFVLLITVLLVSSIALVIILDESDRIYTLQSMNDEAFNKAASLELARGCRNEALLSLALDPFYRAAAVKENIGSSTCTIVSISTIQTEASGTEMNIDTSASSNNTFSNIRTAVFVLPTSLVLQSSYEIPDFN